MVWVAKQRKMALPRWTFLALAGGISRVCQYNSSPPRLRGGVAQPAHGGAATAQVNGENTPGL